MSRFSPTRARRVPETDLRPCLCRSWTNRWCKHRRLRVQHRDTRRAHSWWNRAWFYQQVEGTRVSLSFSFSNATSLSFVLSPAKPLSRSPYTLTTHSCKSRANFQTRSIRRAGRLALCSNAMGAPENNLIDHVDARSSVQHVRRDRGPAERNTVRRKSVGKRGCETSSPWNESSRESNARSNSSAVYSVLSVCLILYWSLWLYLL